MSGSSKVSRDHGDVSGATGGRPLTRREALASFGAGALGLAFGGGLAACGGGGGGAAGGSGSAGKPLGFGYQSAYDYGMFYVAQQRGWLGDGSVKLNLKFFDSGVPELEAMSGGSIDAGVMGSIPALTAASQGVFPVRMVTALDEILAVFSLVAQPGIKSLKDLKGKTVFVPLASNNQFFLQQVLRAAKLDEGDVKLVNSEPKDVLAAFLSSRADAMVPDTITQYVVKSKKPDASILYTGAQFEERFPNPADRPLMFDVMVASADSVAARRADLLSVLKAYHGPAVGYVTSKKTVDKAADQLARWQARVSGGGEGPAHSLVVDELRTINWYSAQGIKNVMGNGVLKTALTRQAQFLKDVGTIKSLPDFDEFIDPSLVNSI